MRIVPLTLSFLAVIANGQDAETPAPTAPPSAAPLPISLIHDVRASSIVGDAVRVEGVVTALFFGRSTGPIGFFIQEEEADSDGDPSTSDAIYVACPGEIDDIGPCTNLAVSDLVRAQGLFGDDAGMAEIDASDGEIVIISSGVDLPPPVDVALPAEGSTKLAETFENVEGMLVRISTTLVVSDTSDFGLFGQLVLSEGSRPFHFTEENPPDAAGYATFLGDLATRQIILDDNNNLLNAPVARGGTAYPYPTDGGFPNGGLAIGRRFRGGDTITDLTGVMHWSGAGLGGTDAWRIRPVDGIDYVFDSVNLAPQSPGDVGGTFKVASMNSLSYFTSFDESGARGQDELVRQRSKLVAALEAMDADAVGLTEIENSFSDSATADLVDGINAKMGNGTYAFVETGAIGGGDAKVAFIYKPSTVELIGSYSVLSSSVDPRFDDTFNRPTLIQTFRHIPSSGVLTIANVQLASKEVSCTRNDDPDMLDGQGNCAKTRANAMSALVDYLATDPTNSRDSDFLILGNFNAYSREEAISTILNSGYLAVIENEDPLVESYTTSSDGLMGSSDYVFANNELLTQVTGYSEWHINADEIFLFDFKNCDQEEGERVADVKSCGGGDLYSEDAFRSTRNDPIVIGLELADTAPLPTAPPTAPPPTNAPVASQAPSSSPSARASPAPTAAPLPISLIHDVRASSIVGDAVRVEGVVTALFFGRSTGPIGFFIQEEEADSDGDPSTSDAIYVACPGEIDDIGPCTNLAVSDLVRAQGLFGDDAGMAEIDASDGEIVIISSGVDLPPPVDVALPAEGSTKLAETFENVEGMLVRISTTLVVSDTSDFGLFGQLVLSEGSRPFHFTEENPPDAAGYATFLGDLATRQIILDDNNNLLNAPVARGGTAYPYPTDGGFPNGGLAIGRRFRGGDTITDLTGVMHWSGAGLGGTDAWRIRPVDGIDYVFDSVNLAPQSPGDVGGTFKVASMNSLSYFTSFDESGARGQDELVRQRSKLVAALEAMDADAVGLTEIENSFSDSATADLVDGINAKMGNGTYAFVETGAIGGGDAKVAFIYKPSTVELIGSYSVLSSSVDPRFDDTFNRPTLIQTFRHIPSSGVLTIANVQLASKEVSCTRNDDPDMLDGQGNCAKTRANAMSALVDYLATDPTKPRDQDYLIIGDFNSYEAEDTVIHTSLSNYTDVSGYIGEVDSKYTTCFEGLLGTTIYAFANDELLSQVTGYSEWHINADEIFLFDFKNCDQEEGERVADVKSCGGGDLYAPDPLRASVVDPILVGFDLIASTPYPTASPTVSPPTISPRPTISPQPTASPVQAPSNEGSNAPAGRLYRVVTSSIIMILLSMVF